MKKNGMIESSGLSLPIPPPSRFETTIAGCLAKVECRRSDSRMIITHTEVHEALRGKGVGQKRLTFVVKYAQKKELEVGAECGLQTGSSIAMPLPGDRKKADKIQPMRHEKNGLSPSAKQKE
jgi:predicted GNAT family acetyltransferase